METLTKEDLPKLAHKISRLKEEYPRMNPNNWLRKRLNPFKATKRVNPNWE